MRLSSTILVIALLCLSGISFANTSDSSELICQFDKSTMINEKLKKAQECINNGNYTAAKNYLNGVLKLDSNNEKAKELLAYELTKLVHGNEEADKADAAAKAIFAGGGNSDDMPSTTIAAADLTDGKIGILTLLVKCGLCPSNGEARRLVTQNGIAVNGEKFTDPKGLVDLSEPVVIKKGKKIFHKAIAE